MLPRIGHAEAAILQTGRIPLLSLLKALLKRSACICACGVRPAHRCIPNGGRICVACPRLIRVLSTSPIVLFCMSSVPMRTCCAIAYSSEAWNGSWGCLYIGRVSAEGCTQASFTRCMAAAAACIGRGCAWSLLSCIYACASHTAFARHDSPVQSVCVATLLDFLICTVPADRALAEHWHCAPPWSLQCSRFYCCVGFGFSTTLLLHLPSLSLTA